MESVRNGEDFDTKKQFDGARCIDGPCRGPAWTAFFRDLQSKFRFDYWIHCIGAPCLQGRAGDVSCRSEVKQDESITGENWDEVTKRVADMLVPTSKRGTESPNITNQCGAIGRRRTTKIHGRRKEKQSSP